VPPSHSSLRKIGPEPSVPCCRHRLPDRGLIARSLHQHGSSLKTNRPAHSCSISPVAMSSKLLGFEPQPSVPNHYQRRESALPLTSKVRTSHACDRCRLMRAKCSGGDRCVKCTKDGAACAYGDRKRERNRKFFTHDHITIFWRADTTQRPG
jgi:hypothetical protein